MKRLALAFFFLSISFQPLYCETLTDENTYTNDLAKTTYFAGASSLEENQKLVRKPASIQKEAFYKRYMESKEDRFDYIFQQN